MGLSEALLLGERRPVGEHGDAGTVLTAGEHVDADVVGEGEVSAGGRVGVDGDAVAAPVLVRGVDLEDAGDAAAFALGIEEGLRAGRGWDVGVGRVEGGTGAVLG